MKNRLEMNSIKKTSMRNMVLMTFTFKIRCLGETSITTKVVFHLHSIIEKAKAPYSLKVI